MPKIICKSNAKLNLSLKVVGKRADNYHLLDSIFVPLSDIYDLLTIDFGAKESCFESNLEPQNFDYHDNLITRAVNKYFEIAKIDDKIAIHLEKNIPIGAGLGGGSSNAAFTLKLLNDYYQALHEETLHGIAISLGADVPFFLVNKIARITGIGENIQTLESKNKLFFVLIYPQFPISTPWAFRNLDLSLIGIDSDKKNDKILKALACNDFDTIAQNLHNDLAVKLYDKFVLYDIIRDFLLKNGASGFGISGSGSSCFGICESEEVQIRLLQVLKQWFAEENFWIAGCGA